MLLLSHQTKFIAWMSFLCCLFALAGAMLVWTMDQLLVDNHAQKIQDYNLTLILGYLWCRLCLHEITMNVLSGSSPIFRGMPEGLQRDCAFMAVEGPSIFFWAPSTAYLVGIIFMEGNVDTVLEKIGPYIYYGSTLYVCDRFMHIYNCFRFDRFIHHALTFLWMVAVNEWVPRNAVDFSYLCLSLSMEIMEGKIRYFWFFIIRMTRRHARSVEEWGTFDSNRDEIDSLIIPKSARAMVFYSRIFLGYVVLFEVVAPITLLGVYFHIYQDEALLFWKIASPCLYLAFVIIDIDYMKEKVKYCKLSSWSKTVMMESSSTSLYFNKTMMKSAATSHTNVSEIVQEC